MILMLTHLNQTYKHLYEQFLLYTNLHTRIQIVQYHTEIKKHRKKPCIGLVFDIVRAFFVQIPPGQT